MPRFSEKDAVKLFDNTVGYYDTKKRILRSERKLPDELLEQIEQGEITSELLVELSLRFSVYRYKTCITIHAGFDEMLLPKVKGYKNLKQNKNRSIEVLYSAIDAEKKIRISKYLDKDWMFHRNSSSNYYQLIKTYKNFKESQSILAELREKSSLIEKVDFYGNTQILHVPSVMGLPPMLVLRLNVNAIKEKEVDSFICAVNGINQSELSKLKDSIEEEYQEELKKQEREKKELLDKEKRIERDRIPFDKLVENLPPVEKGIKSFLGIQVVIYGSDFPCFRITYAEKGAFGRYRFGCIYTDLKFEKVSKIHEGSMQLDFKAITQKVNKSVSLSKHAEMLNFSEKVLQAINKLRELISLDDVKPYIAKKVDK